MNRPGAPRSIPTLVAATLYTWTAVAASETTPPRSFAEAQAEAAGRQVPLLLDFYTEW